MSENRMNLDTPRFKRLLARHFDAHWDLVLLRALARIDAFAAERGVVLEPYELPAKQEEVTLSDERWLSELNVTWD